MHTSQSETVGQLLPDGVERQLRAQLRALRFGQPLEYAKLQQVEVRKFLSSKSVHNWLSEWELATSHHNFGTLERRCGGVQAGGGTRSTRMDASVQCAPEQIDAEMVGGHAAADWPYEMSSSAPIPNSHLAALPPYRQMPPPANCWQPFPSAAAMDASTNTETATETTGTGGMNVFRRASYLEEYASDRVREMEEQRAAEEERRRARRKVTRNKRRCWRLWRCCCCCPCGCSKCCRREGSQDASGPSVEENLQPPHFSSSGGGSEPASGRTNLTDDDSAPMVRKCTLSRSGGIIGCGGRYHAPLYPPGVGNYDNVREEWIRKQHPCSNFDYV